MEMERNAEEEEEELANNLNQLQIAFSNADSNKGYSIYYFICGEYMSGIMSSLAQSGGRGIIPGFDHFRPCSFYEESQFEIRDISQISLLHEISFSLNPLKYVNSVKGVGYDSTTNILFVAYEKFDDSFFSWAKERKNRQKMSREWWLVQIRHIFETLYEMKKLNFYHGSLEEQESYVIVDDEIHLINVGIKGSDNAARNKELGEEDLVGFQSFLRYQLVDLKFRDDLDWPYFWLSLDISTIEQVKTHPLLLEGPELYLYVRRMIRYVRYVMSTCDTDYFQDLLEDPSLITHHISPEKYSLSTPERWNCNFQPDEVFFWILYHDLLKNNPSQIPQTTNNVEVVPKNMKELFNFVEKVLDRFHHQKRPPVGDYEQTAQRESTTIDHGGLMKKITQSFPAFLSRIHHCLVIVGQVTPEKINKLWE